MDRNQAIQRIKALTDPRIDEVGLLLLNFGMELIACGDETKIVRRGQDIGHIDLLFKDVIAKKLFFIEVSIKEKQRSRKMNSFFSLCDNKSNVSEIRKRFSLPRTYGVIRLYFDLSGKIEPPETVVPILGRHSKVINTDDLKYFSTVYGRVGVWARNDFYSFLNVKPNTRTNEKKEVIAFLLNGVRAYCYVDSAKNLLEYCYVFRRKANDDGYQRMIEEVKIGRIVKKIRRGNILAFPNSILISCPDEKIHCEKDVDLTNCPCVTNVILPNYYCACRVIDGQHRLMGFARMEDALQEDHFMPVVLLADIDEKVEMKTFIEINSGQKKIDRNLILVLEADRNWDVENNRKEYFEKIAVEIVKRLNKNKPLKGKIFIPHATAVRKNKITLNTLVSAIIGNNFIGKRLALFQEDHSDIETPYIFIHGIFVQAGRELPDYCQDVGSFLLTNKGLRILFRLVQVLVRNDYAENVQCNLAEFFHDLSEVFTDELVEKLKDFYGEGGANKAVEEIFKKVKRINRERYKKLITDLRNI